MYPIIGKVAIIPPTRRIAAHIGYQSRRHRQSSKRKIGGIVADGFEKKTAHNVRYMNAA